MQNSPLRLTQLDGLRGCAVLGVLLSHYGFLTNGWAGVDIFFVISGYLITKILRCQRHSTNYWSDFYRKRAARILPPLMLSLLLAIIANGRFTAGMIGYVLFAGNIVQLTPAAVSALSPLWSLAIEEHFYLAWPSAVRTLSRNRLLATSLGIAFISPIIRFLGTVVLHMTYGSHVAWDSPIYLLTIFRLDGLALGSVLALAMERADSSTILKRWAPPCCLCAGFVYVCSAALSTQFRRSADSEIFNTFGYSLIALFSFLLVSHLITSPNSIASRALKWKPLTLLGTISYGVYLYQVPLLQLAEHLLDNITYIGRRGALIAAFFLTIALAASSYWLIEKPFISAGRRKNANIKNVTLHTDTAEMGG